MSQQLHLLVGDDDGLTVLNSRDGGHSWGTPQAALTGVEVCAIAATPEGEVYVGTRGQGVFRNSNGLGGEWVHIEVPPELEKVRALAITKDRFLAGTEPAGVYEWAGRQSWEPVGNINQAPGSKEWFYPVPTEGVHIRHVAVDPNRPERLYAAIQVGGVGISPDNGATWTDRRNLDLDVHMVEPDPTRPGRLYAGTGGGGLYESLDSGETWRCISEGCGNFVVQFAIDPSNPRRVYLGTAQGHPRQWVNAGGARGEVFLSDDAGQTWRKLSQGLPDPLESRVNTITVDAENPANVFFGGGLGYQGAVARDGGVYHSPDAGESWQRIFEAKESLIVWCGRS